LRDKRKRIRNPYKIAKENTRYIQRKTGYAQNKREEDSLSRVYKNDLDTESDPTETQASVPGWYEEEKEEDHARLSKRRRNLPL